MKGGSKEEGDFYNFDSSRSVGELATEPDFAAAVQEVAEIQVNEVALVRQSGEKWRYARLDKKSEDSMRFVVDSAGQTKIYSQQWYSKDNRVAQMILERIVEVRRLPQLLPPTSLLGGATEPGGTSLPIDRGGTPLLQPLGRSSGGLSALAGFGDRKHSVTMTKEAEDDYEEDWGDYEEDANEEEDAPPAVAADELADSAAADGDGAESAASEATVRENGDADSADAYMSIEPAGGGAPGWTARSWLSSLPLLDIIGQELLIVSGLDTRTSEEADCIKALSTEAIEAAVDAAASKIKGKLREAVAMLRQTNDVDARLLNEKFAADEKTFTFRYGGMEDYHSGLEGMIGNPDPRVAEAVEWEHTQSMESSKEFSCWWKGNTTAKTEYNYVVSLAAKEEDTTNGRREEGRDGWTLERFMCENDELISTAKLQKVEVTLLRLYTGQIYLANV